MISAPILRKTVEEISASATMTKGKSHNDDSQNEAQKKKQEKSTAKADDVSVNQPSTMTNIGRAVTSTAKKAVYMASRIGAGLSLKDTINNMGWKSNADSFGMTGKQDSSSTSTSTGTTENPVEEPAANESESSEAEKTYSIIGYAPAGLTETKGKIAARYDARAKMNKIIEEKGLSDVRVGSVTESGVYEDGEYYFKMYFKAK